MHPFARTLFRILAGFVILAYSAVFVFFVMAKIRYSLDSGPISEAEVDRLETRLASRLREGDYGVVRHAVWSDLFAQSFFAYGLANRYDRSPSEARKTALVSELDRILRNIETVQRDRMRLGVGDARTEGGIIYQGHRLRVLALLAKYRRDTETKERLFSEARKLAGFLESAPKRTEESYPGWAWWVDNVDAYAALSVAGSVLGTDIFAPTISSWSDELRAARDADGNLPAEAYGPFAPENQPRSPAAAWMVPSLALASPEAAESELESLGNFSDSLFGMPVMREVPNGQTLVNRVSTGPVVFGASSAGTMLAVAAYSSLGDFENAERFEKTVRAAFFVNRQDMSVAFGLSALLESVFYWTLSFRNGVSATTSIPGVPPSISP